MSNQEPATILLIDDHPMLRTGVKQLISMAPDITVVGEASNGEQGIELAESLDPDLILLDLNMPGMNGLETLVNCAKSPSQGALWYSASLTMKRCGHRTETRRGWLSVKRYGTGRSAESIASGSCWRNGIKRSINACSGRQLAR